MQILTMGNDLLKQKAVRIDKIDSKIRELAGQMLEALAAEKGIGLAAVQLGIMKRIFVTRVQNDEERIFINPSILETSVKTTKYEEGCLSIPGIYGQVVRSELVTVQAWNEKGRPFTIEAEGLLARVIQHEYDHLEGILFLDRMPDDKRIKLAEKYKTGAGRDTN